VIPTSPSLKEGADILLKLSTGLPALLSRQVGKGRVLFFASTLDRGWSDFPMKSIFLPFIQESVHFLASNPATEGEGAEFVVGQPVPVSVPATTGPLTVEAPGGERSLLEVIGEEPGAAGAVALSRQAFRKTDLPGHYLVFEQADGSEPIERDDLSFAVNVPPIESQLGPMAPERLSGVLPDVPTVVEGQSTESQAFVTVTRKRKLAQPIMWLVLALLIVEGLMTVRRHGVQGAQSVAPEANADISPSATSSSA